MTREEAIKLVVADQFQIDSEWGNGDGSGCMDTAVEILTALGIPEDEIRSVFA